MEIVYSSKFAREYKKLSEDIKDLAEQKETIFRQNPFDPKLKTHKLSGRLREFWAFSIDYKYRIVFEFASDDLVYFHAVGTHDVYK
jgi:addiction module RelE/StbE family toxin